MEASPTEWFNVSRTKTVNRSVLLPMLDAACLNQTTSHVIRKPVQHFTPYRKNHSEPNGHGDGSGNDGRANSDYSPPPAYAHNNVASMCVPRRHAQQFYAPNQILSGGSGHGQK